MNAAKQKKLLEGLCLHELLDKTNVHDAKKCVTIEKACGNEMSMSTGLEKSGNAGKIMHVKGSDANVCSTISAEQIALIESADSLEMLAQIMSEMPHPFKQFSKNMVFSDGVSSAKIMVIGEAPGAEEDEQRKPFVGQSGMLLMDIFKTIGLLREKNFYITNILPWRPPMNQTPSADEIKFFLPYVKKHVKLVKPSVLVLIGATAYKAISLISSMDDKQTITQVHGKISDVKIDDCDVKVCVLLHPSYLLRLPAQKKNMWRDVVGLEKVLKGIKGVL